MTHATPILVALLLAAAPQAQQADFIHLTPRDGLSDGFVWPILQSQDGYMWFGTGAGLDRFDGYTVERFMHDPNDETSIRDGRIVSLLEAPDGSLWFGAGSGLGRMDPRSRHFTAIDIDASVSADSLWVMEPWGLHRTSDGAIWVGTANGLYTFPEDDPTQITRYGHDPGDHASIGASRINVIVDAADGALWLGTLQDGLTRFDRATGTAVHYRRDPELAGGLSDDGILDLHVDGSGHVWAATAQGGLCRFDPRAESFQCFRHDPADPGSLSDDRVQSIFADEEGRLWLGTDGGGVSIFDPAAGTFTAFRHDPGNAASLGEDDVHKVYRDRFGTVWFAHHDRGLSRTTPGDLRFVTRRALPEAAPSAPVNQISDFLEDDDGVIWMSTTHGLVRHDPASGSREHFVPFPEQPPRSAIPGNRNLLGALLSDSRGRLWTGNVMGDLLVFDPRERAFRHVETPARDDLWLFPGRWVHPVTVDRDGHVWIAAIGLGLWRLDPETDHITEYFTGVADDGGPVPGVALVYLDDQGELWRADFAGQDFSRPLFLRYDAAAGSFEHFDIELPDNLSYGRVFMFADRPGEFWLPSGAGVHRADAATGAVDFYSRGAYGMPVGMNGLERDRHGRLWYGTWTGSFGMLDPERGTTFSFFPQDGVHVSRVMASRRLASGEFVFMGFGGYVRFHPDEVVGGGTPPVVRLSALHAAGELVDLQVEGGALRVPHDRNTLAFEYVGLHFADPARNQYRYMLEGFDVGWNRVGPQRSALYPRLPPGRYTFRVQAASSGGIWNDEGAQVAFVVLPPWWRTWWAYAFYGLMLVGGVFGADRVQRRRVVQKERERAREQELRHAREIEKAYESLKAAQAQLVQQEKLASLGALTAGIAHEIKNPLNFVNNFGQLTGELIEELRESLAEHPAALAAVDGLLSDLKMNTSKIEQHGKRADSIVKSMLQHSRGGSGTREAVDLNALVEEYVSLAYHGKRAQQPGFNVDLSRDFAPDVGTVEVVSQDVGRVVLNLVGNAFDAVSEHAEASRDGAYTPSVRVSTLRTKAGVQVRVEDNGPGIPPEIREKIFDPFFTTKAAGQGTGLGLSMSHEIVTQGHGGQLQVESRPGGGTTFTVSLPDSRT